VLFIGAEGDAFGCSQPPLGLCNPAHCVADEPRILIAKGVIDARRLAGQRTEKAQDD
jgi:hypothetical protein